jgi:hypothetical protein
MTLALASEEDVDGGKKLCGFADALLGSFAFSVKPGIMVGQKPIVLFFGEDLREPHRKFPRLDKMETEQASHRPMGGDVHSFSKQRPTGGMRASSRK